MGIERLLYVISTEICRSVFSAAFCLSIWPDCGKKNFVKYFFPNILDIDRKLISLCSNFFSAKLTTLAFTSPRYQFDERKTFWQIFVCFIYHLRTLSKKIKAFFGKQSAALSKWLTTCPRRFFAENFFFKKVLFLFQHWALSERFLSFRRKFVGPFVSTVFCLSIGPVSGEQMFVQTFFYNIYGHSAKICLFFSENLSVNLTKLHSTSPEENLNTKHCFGKDVVCFFHVLPKLNGEITVFFVKNTIGKFVTFAYHVSKNIFWRSFFLKKFFFFIIGHWATFVCHFDEILSVQMSVLLSVCQFDQFVVKKFLSDNFFSINYRHWSQIDQSLFEFFRPSWRHWLLRVQGINLTKEKRFDKSLFVSFIICGPWAKKSRLFSENNRQRCQNGWPRVQRDFLQRIFFSKKFFFYFSIGHWANVFCHFDGSLSVPLSVLLSVCQ